MPIPTQPPPAPAIAWQALEPGLELAEIQVPDPAVVGDRVIRVLRVDPARFALTVAVGPSRTAPQHVDAHPGWVAAINAGMFEPGGAATFELRAPDGAGNPTRRADAGSFLVADPRDPSDPAVRLLDRACDDVAAITADYRVVAQGFRLLTCTGKVTWSEGPRIWSHAVLGFDHAGHPLLIHCRTPYGTAAFTRILAGLPLDLDRLMYLEGGPEATLAVDAGAGPTARDSVWYGSYETGFWPSDDNDHPWPIPNVIGVVRR